MVQLRTAVTTADVLELRTPIALCLTTIASRLLDGDPDMAEELAVFLNASETTLAELRALASVAPR